MSNSKIIPLNIKFVNIRGLGFYSKGKYKLDKVPFKIKELTASANYKPHIYICLETKLKCSHKDIRLPNGCKYGGETSGNEASGGIFVYHDNLYEVIETKTIISKYAMYLKYKIGDRTYHFIPVYLPTCSAKDLEDMLRKISIFIQDHNLTEFSFLGDLNVDFNKVEHYSRAKLLDNFLTKYNMYNLANKVGVNPGFTWIGSGQRFRSKSSLDYFFCNFEYFNYIEFNFNSFSDHKSVTIGRKEKFRYQSPKWKTFLFKNKKFLELMKDQTDQFLKQNSDSSPENLTNVTLDNLTFIEAKNQYTGVMFNLIQHLKQEHDKFYSKLRQQEFQKTKDFDLQMDMLYKKIENNDSNNYMLQINELILTQQQYFKTLVNYRAETYYMRNLILDGMPNSLTYQNVRPFKKRNYNLIIDNELTNCREKIADKLCDIHAENVCPNEIPKADLSGLLKTFDLKIDDIFPKIQDVISPYSSCDEFLKVIKSMKNSSSPGPTSEPKALYLFLFQNVPKFATNAFNQIYDIENIDNSDFAFIKLKNVCFLPKKDLDSSEPNNLRPIYLSEVSQKILDKALNNKISNYMTKIVHADQFGFIKQRHMATATISITAIMNYIKTKEIDSQLVFFDLKKAYDKTLYEVSDAILGHIFSKNFAKIWASISNGGKFRVVVDNYVSKVREIKLGFAQGAPSSANKFVIYNHLFFSCLNSNLLSHLMLKINKQNLPAIFFADDGFKGLKLKSENDVHTISNVLKKLKSTVNIEVNFKKTKILVYGNSPANLNILGAPCSHVKHLGVYLSFDFKNAYELTYKELLEKFSNRSRQISFKYGSNIFKRRNVCLAFMNSLAFHIYRIYSPNEAMNKQIWKHTSKFLWSSPSGYRFKVAKKRIELDFIDGGLNMLLPEQQSFSIWLTSFFNVLKHAEKYPKSNLAIILANKHVPISSITKNFGSKTIRKYRTKFDLLYPMQDKKNFRKLCVFMEELEKKPLTFLNSTISTSYWSKDIKFTNAENRILTNSNIVTLASIIKCMPIKHKFLYLPIINENLKQTLSGHNQLYEKIAKIVKNISNEFEFNTLECISSKQSKNSNKTIMTMSFNSPSIFALYFKQMHKKKIWSAHPSLNSRKIDKKWFPDMESFKYSFNIILNLPITMYFKSFLFEQFTRTLVSSNKLFKWNIIESNLCKSCKVINDSEHAIFECKFAKYFAHCMATFLDKIYNNECPEFIFLKENFYLFNIYYECFKGDDFTQITLLILIAKDRALKASKEECIIRWNEDNFFSQTLLLAQFTIKLLNSIGLNYSLVTNFIDFVLGYKDNTKYFSC